jgi:hypothetical protein
MIIGGAAAIILLSENDKLKFPLINIFRSPRIKASGGLFRNGLS